MARQAGEAGRQRGCSLKHPAPFTGRNKAIKAINLPINKPFRLSNTPTNTRAWELGGGEEGMKGAVPLVPPGSLSHYLSLSDSVSLNYSDKSKDLKVFFFNLKSVAI